MASEEGRERVARVRVAYFRKQIMTIKSVALNEIQVLLCANDTVQDHTTRIRRTGQTKLLRVESMESAGQTELLVPSTSVMIYRTFALFSIDCTSRSSGLLACVKNASS